ncbi:MAG TPA: hypothetical protein VFV54_00080 [Thermoanaerobaculia bacterium]|nr:hypothetical protein [Thermoanaerobaculia bacterium]
MRFPWSYAKRVVAGAIFGLYMAHLLYYLNPQIEITPARLILVTLIYGAVCGLIFGSILWGFRWLRLTLFGRGDAAARPHGFGFVVAAAFLSAFVYWTHLALLRVYLPLGAIRILSKATTVIGATAVVLLALWLFERTATRRTSRILFTAGVALIFVSSFFLYQRREGYRSENRAPVVAQIAMAQERAAIVVAVHGLPYDWIITARGEGTLPFLSGAIDRGFFTRVEPFSTTSPKALWASLNTGKLPNRHGVTGRFSYQTPLNRPDEPFLLVPMGVGFKGWGLVPPVRRISASLPAGSALPFWRAWERVGFDARIFGWTEPGPVPQQARDREDGLLPEDRARLDAAAASPRAALTAIEIESLERLPLPGAAPNDLPPRHTPKGEAIRAILAELDARLALIAERNPDALLALASPAAPEPPELPVTLPTILRAIERSQDPGADDGLLLLVGESVTPRPNPAPVRVVDLVPTLLFASGLPIGRDMDGRVLTEAFTDAFLRAHPIQLIQSYEGDRLEARRTPPPAAQSDPQVPSGRR